MKFITAKTILCANRCHGLRFGEHRRLAVFTGGIFLFPGYSIIFIGLQKQNKKQNKAKFSSVTLFFFIF